MRSTKSILIILITLVLSGCAIREYVPEGKTVLIYNDVVIDSEESTDISTKEASYYITQQPDRNLYGWLPRVWVYYKTVNKTSGFGKWINRSIGHKPTYYNNQNTINSRHQIEDYLNNIGYFKSKVTTQKIEKRKRSKVVYTINPTKPYHIRNIGYKVKDTAVLSKIMEIENEMPVKEGDVYNAFTMDKQRDLITSYLRDNGYYFFTKDYIVFEVDTNLRQNKADITVRIDGDKHDKYVINKVFVNPNYNVQNPNTEMNDTVPFTFKLSKKYPEYRFDYVYSSNPKINFKTFNQVILMHPGEYYSNRKVTQTYRAMGGLKLYSRSNISFDTVPGGNDSVKLLNCNVALQRGKLNHYNIQLEGTNSGGDLGALGSISYRNNNIFRGSEVLRITLRGGVQAQKVEDYIIDEGMFNTKEFGIDASILFPRFLSPIPLSRFVLEYQPKTTLSAGFNGQIRPLYSRYIITGTYGYNWKASSHVEHIFTPLNLNTVKVLPTELFELIMCLETNQRIRDMYTDHLIFGLNYSFIYNNQNINSNHDFIYFKADFETSGNLLSLFNNTPLITTNDNYHEIAGIRYAQYIRYQFDFRVYHYFTPEKVIALRMMYGQGLAYGNSVDLPFEKSFYAGGTNGMRGWQYRMLGPGEFVNDTGYDIEHIGDLQLEFNLEYRFPLYAFMKGAIFSDVGNIWTLSNNESFYGGQFKFDKFYKQLAVDAGFGLRFDFDFFLIRFDWAVPLRDPAYPDDSRWRISKLQWSDIVWNFGIGYPF